MVMTARWTGISVLVGSGVSSASVGTGATGASSSGRTKPRSTRNAPSLSMLTKMPAR
jgi:hypothetical protein